jgi:CheY-like chemotaxis protein
MNPALRRRTVLVVDDEAPSFELFRFILENGGFRAVLASRGAEALRLAKDEHPDLILLDLLMPGMTGLEVCRRLKADPPTAAIPVVFVSAVAGRSEIEEGLRTGGADYIVKPFDPDEIVRKVRAQLQD